MPEDGAFAPACCSCLVALRTLLSAQAHPPAAGGQPLPCSLQHHAFFATLQPAIQFANPALQSKGGDVVAQPPPVPGQPLPCTLQHHAFLPTDQPACQFAYPSAQLYGSAGGGAAVGTTGGTYGGTYGGGVRGGAVGGQPLWCTRQHQ